ncbi:hypothetical protein [Pannonibacter phragmitetus]|uniref:hypothetical protein n=1 Tax=Pannonibacter phragmitetus TaxID=121719 RepID=UPI00135CE90F|nr:hypothetical protein [Pannonibacter phragmitetus]
MKGKPLPEDLQQMASSLAWTSQSKITLRRVRTKHGSLYHQAVAPDFAVRTSSQPPWQAQSDNSPVLSGLPDRVAAYQEIMPPSTCYGSMDAFSEPVTGCWSTVCVKQE